MRRVIITGATSYIAVTLIKKLILNECIVYAVIRPDSKNKDKIPVNNNIHLIEMAMEEIEKLPQLGLTDVDAVFHFAWEGTRGLSREDNLIQYNNCLFTKKCINASIAMKIPYFIGIGSQAEYGITNGLTTEDTLLNADTEYGKKKIEVYNYGMYVCTYCKTTFVWARLFSAYGIGENENTLVMQCIKKMKNNETIDLSPCEQIWDYIYIDDVAEALFQLWRKKAPSGAYNIGYGHARKLKEYVMELKSILKSESILNFGSLNSMKLPVQIEPDISKLILTTDWEPTIDFTTGVLKMLDMLD